MNIRWGLGLAVGLGLLVCGYYLVWDWDKSLLGVHNFRQTQTAITSYYFIHEGFTLNYQTPVMGKPWVIPFEFPFYQILAALLTEMALIDLDRAGRIVSVLFWIACLFPLDGILRWWVQDQVVRWAVILLIWSSSTSIYWSDSFMMESTSLFFSLMFMYSLVRSIRQTSGWLVLLATLCGLMAGLQKATTFMIAVVPTLGFVGMELYRRPINRLFWKNLARILVALAVPMAGVNLWTRHADALKALNPVARHFITSQALTTWNFGTLTQRVSLDVWQRVISIEAEWGLGHGSFWILLAAVLTLPVAIWRGRYRMEILILSAAYMTGPLVFTNLFYVHEYYNYENSIYLELAFSLAVIGLVEPLAIKQPRRKKRKAPPQQSNSTTQVGISCGILLGISAWGIYFYNQQWVPYIASLPTSETVRQALSPVTNAGDPQDILLLYGLDWNPCVPYYSGRKAIMDKEARPLDNPAIQESLANFSPDQHIAAMIVGGPLSQDASFIQERVKLFHLESTPINTPWGPCYLKSP